MPEHHVAVLGASPKPERFSHRAVVKLRKAGYRVTPVHPRAAEIAGLPAVADLASVPRPVDTLTLYVGPQRLLALQDDILALRPGRVIFNPGTATPELQRALDAAGIPWLAQCTLVLLDSGRFLDGT